MGWRGGGGERGWGGFGGGFGEVDGKFFVSSPIKSLKGD